MKGIVLAGGLGTRLVPITRVVNKHLLPVYDRPMISHALATMRALGVGSVSIVTRGEDVADFKRVLWGAAEQGFEALNYVEQPGVGGIADALRCARRAAGGGPCCVMLGDNVFERVPSEAAEAFRCDPKGAMLMLAREADPRRFGVARFEGEKLVEIVEKPALPPSDRVVTGLYFFDETVFDRCDAIEPSSRGELEISDVVNGYIREGRARWREVSGWWLDAGTFEDLARATVVLSRGRTQS